MKLKLPLLSFIFINLYSYICNYFCFVDGLIIDPEVLLSESRLCDSVLCSGDTICRDGKCIPNPCQDVQCADEEQCFVKDVYCITFPCNPIAVCKPIREDPCATIRCGFNSSCVNGVCVTNDCLNVACPTGQECITKVNPCLIPPCPVFPTCVPTDLCDSVSCIDGTVCIEGRCYPDTSFTCENISCNFGEECYYQTVQCVRAPCPPIPSCRPFDQCSNIQCEFGTTCFDGVCVPDTCESTDCGVGEKCVMTPIACFVAPCPTEIPLCFPIDENCIATTCLEGTSCVEGECIPNSCETLECNTGEDCILEKNRCSTPPCPIVATCVSITDPCSLLLCRENTICVDGKCVPFVPTCGDITCYFGEECYFQKSECSASTCSLIPVCKPVDRCANVNCRPNYMCMNGRCVRQTCNRYSCGPGEECYFDNDPCYAFRVPSCRPDTNKGTTGC